MVEKSAQKVEWRCPWCEFVAKTQSGSRDHIYTTHTVDHAEGIAGLMKTARVRQVLGRSTKP
jgi:hypothetical protein